MVEDFCCEIFASRGATAPADFNFCPWCGTNFENPQFLYFINPRPTLTTDEFMNEWYGEDGYRGYAGFRRSEQRAMQDLVEDYLLKNKEKSSVFVHRVDISNARRIHLSENHLTNMIAYFGTAATERHRELAEQVIKNKEDLLRMKKS